MAKTNVERLKKLQLPGQRSDIPPVVAVRKEDLREIESGREKVLAWNRAQKATASSTTYFPGDFDPSKLPVGGQLPASGILPPLSTSSDQAKRPDNTGDLSEILETPASSSEDN